MATENYEIVGSYNNQRITSLDGERSINLFEYIDPLAKKQKSLLCTSGLVDSEFNFLTASGGFRAQFVFKDVQYVVIGSQVLSITAAGTVALLGTFISSSVGYVGIDANTHQVIFVDGQNGFIWDTTNSTFRLITDASFPIAPLDVCFLDGFFVVINGNTNNFQLSQFNQGMVWGPGTNTFTYDVPNSELIITTTANYATGVAVTVSAVGNLQSPLLPSTTYWAINIDTTHIKLALTLADAMAGIPIVLTATTPAVGVQTILNNGQLQLGSITTHPGTLVACRTLHRKLFLFSQFFTEIWENAGAPGSLPFRRNNTLLMEYGTPAIGSVATGFDKMFFLSQDRDGLGSVMEVDGTQSGAVSTRALDFQLAQYAELQQVADCRAFLIKENGLIFYRMNFTLANHTFVYNVTLSSPQSDNTKYWHEEETLRADRHPSQTHAYFNGLNYVGNFALPLLYIVDDKEFTNNGEAIPRRRIGRPIVPAAYQRTRIDRFELDLLQGNVAFLNFEDVPLIIQTESGLDLLTEDGNTLITNQALQESNQQMPVVFLSWSKDGGQTFGFQLVAPMGQVGDRTFRTIWRKLGVVPRGQAFVPKLEFFNTGPFIVLGASWSFEVLPQ